VEILFFRGKGLINSLVRWQTNSHFAHVAIRPYSNPRDLQRNMIVEALPKYGVRRRVLLPTEEYFTAGFAGQPVFATETGKYVVFNPDAAADFLDKQIGKKYDYQGVLRFVTREKSHYPERWFCSELAFAYLRAGGVKCLNMDEAWRVSPGMLALSPYLQTPWRVM
jgi:uncharacterized protein YycO